MWVPTMVFLNYLPDIVAQVSLLFGWRGAEIVLHSLVSGVLLSFIISPGLKVFARLSFSRAYFISLFFILVHDLLDLLQTPERLILWPFSTWRPSPEYTFTPLSPIDEFIIFGCFFIASLIIYLVCFYKNNSIPPVKTKQKKFLVWVARISVGIILVLAASTQYLRKIRAEEFKQAKAILETTKNYHLVLDLIEEAERWPYGGSLAWIDYFKARAYWGLGDRKQAELCYQKSLDEYPLNIWCVGDIAILYASSDEHLADRRHRIFPYVKLLLDHFSDHPSLQGYLNKIEAALGAPLAVSHGMFTTSNSKKASTTQN
jgi:membrane-bound metal-dependent hydrolase YbcI (DUF457 family)